MNKRLSLSRIYERYNDILTYLHLTDLTVNHFRE